MEGDDLNIKLGSLFDGIGGFPYAGTMLDINPVWASEIEPFPIRVTEHHFPNMKHLGDITQIDGGEIKPVDIITFGSPCQDLSVAGKREGLAGARSGLFMEAVRIIREMRTATDGQYPRFAVWENVPGAYSSNKGQDFRAVLEEITETEIPMPASGKWGGAGMVRTPDCDVAWRTLDAQYWGVPQRRRRIFLVADFRGTSAGEILFVEEGLSGHFAESRKAWEEITGNTGDGIKGASGNLAYSFDSLASNSMKSKNPHSGGRFVEISKTLDSTTPEPSKNQGGIAILQAREEAVATVGDGVESASYWDGGQIRCCLDCSMLAKGQMMPEKRRFSAVVLADQGGSVMSVHDDVSPTLRAQEHGHQPCILYDMTHADEAMRPVKEGIAPTLNSRMGTGGNQVPVLMQPKGYQESSNVAHCLRSQPSKADKPDSTTYIIQNATRGKSQNGLGISQDDVSYTLDSLRNHAVAYPEPANTLLGKANLSFRSDTDNIVQQGYAVRRLTPLECLRLQGFPDYWLDVGGMSDTAKYKAIGNSVAIPCVLFVLSGIANVLRRRAA